jgi:hypothetical protein
MIFAICGLTVVGAGTDRAGTSSMAGAAVWACPAGRSTIPIAAHKNTIARGGRVATTRTALAGAALIALPPVPSFLNASRNGAIYSRAADILLQHQAPVNIPEIERDARTFRRRTAPRSYSTLIPPS